ncbi:MAG: thiol-disulfide oxidoreductase DCC family protein [Candidatus Nanopelagicus sp.]
MSNLIVIYDGQCQLCANCIAWVSKRLVITPIAYQNNDLSRFDLTIEQCAKSVYVIEDKTKYAGAAAVALILNRRGNKLSALLLRLTGPISQFGYKLIATNRNTKVIKLLSNFIEGRSK